jgi:hypothetical protein
MLVRSVPAGFFFKPARSHQPLVRTHLLPSEGFVKPLVDTFRFKKTCETSSQLTAFSKLQLSALNSSYDFALCQRTSATTLRRF